MPDGSGGSPLGVVRLGEGCALAPRGAGKPCPCESVPGSIRVLLGLPVPLNRASAEDLRAVPGIGPVRAGAIVADRAARGGYASLAELERVRGIGPATLARLRPFLFAGRADPACAKGPAVPWVDRGALRPKPEEERLAADPARGGVTEETSSGDRRQPGQKQGAYPTRDAAAPAPGPRRATRLQKVEAAHPPPLGGAPPGPA